MNRILTLICVFAFSAVQNLAASEPLFTIQLDTINSGFDQKSCWVQPRAGAIVGNPPAIVLTLNQAALKCSDETATPRLFVSKFCRKVA